MYEPRWYDYQFADPLLTTWLLLEQTWAAVYKAGERNLAKVGVTPEKAHLLWVCHHYRGLMTPAELSRLLFRENQSISGLLDRMEKEGLIERVPKRKGRPFTEVKITAKGKELLSPSMERSSAIGKKLMGSLSAEELEQLQKLLRKIRQVALEELRIELVPGPCLDFERVEATR